MIPTKRAARKWRATLAARSEEYSTLVIECDEWFVPLSRRNSGARRVKLKGAWVLRDVSNPRNIAAYILSAT